MATANLISIREILRQKISDLSEKIYAIKKDALKSEKAQKWAFVLNGAQVKEYSEGALWQLVEYDKITSCINPNHPDWNSYQYLRREASIHLTAMAILKSLGGDLDPETSKAEAIGALRARAKAIKASRGQAGFRHGTRHATLAWRRLKKIARKGA